ncbi:amino acid adenylation domain-containing protein [Streptomyces hygroscopicus]|uniref:non-ribosomal peptide synthetase n=1 Tax=Streptomyces hygroscopicus TaxID=1912 RepID=UPI00367823D7
MTTYPMSYEQESVWLNDQFEDSTGRYVESWIHRLHGEIDESAVEAALSGIVARHQTLRTALLLDGGRAVQVVRPHRPVPVVTRQVPAFELDNAIREVVSESIPVDTPPLMRATLLRVDVHDAVLAVTVHHAVIDGWCFRLLDEEFSELYRAVVENRAPSLPSLPLQFGAYAQAQREGAVSAGEEAMAYWRAALDGAPAESTFPLDHPRPAVLSHRGKLMEFAVDAELGATVRRVCREMRTTPFVLLTAALTALLSRLSGQDDVVLGSPVTRRDRIELEPVLACLTDVMPLRQHVRPEQTFRLLVKDTGAVVRSAMAHKGISSGHLVHALVGNRTRARFPLFQVVLTVDDADAPGLSLPKITSERLYRHNGTAKFDVYLNLIPAEGGYRGQLEYATDLFEAATVQRLVERFVALLADATSHPDKAIADLVVLSEAERRLLTGPWSHGPRGREGSRSAHETCARTARRMPDAPAVLDGRRHVSYAELFKASDALAHGLVARGYGRRRIGLALDRSVDSLVAVLGILSAGGVCVPVDPSSAPERTSYMLRDSDAAALLTRRGGVAPGTVPSGLDVLFIDEVLTRGGEVGQAVALPSTGPQDEAYIVYTSGSTGRPKGVVMPHRSLAALQNWQLRGSSMGEGARTLQFAPLGFDVAFQEMFATWAGGGCLVLMDDRAQRNPHRLLDLLDEHAIERLFLPYAALQQLAEYAIAVDRRADSLREVISAGEELYLTPAIKTFFSVHPTARLVNQYGPSETHVVTAHAVGGDSASWPDRSPIGRPVPGCRVYVLDERLEQVPIGCPGEVCVAGDQVALGYVSDPGSTADRFVPDPFGGTFPSPVGDCPRRLYRTGDFGRFLSDGTLQFLGRHDDQVKIRGYRVEPGEAEAALKAVPGIADAVVVADRSVASETRLVGYYLGVDGKAPESTEVRHALSNRLPQYLIPAVLTEVPELPRTASGKTDRAATHRQYARTPRAASVAEEERPTGELAFAVAELWADVLGVERVGMDTSFFSLGGDSLGAVRLSLLLRDRLGLQVNAGAVFAAPTVRTLTASLTRPRPIDGADSAAWRRHLGPEATLPSDIQPASAVGRVVNDQGQVLLTGATGFLGAFLLASLLESTDATVHCLVRADGMASARKRLRGALERYHLEYAAFAGRITPVPGDLTRTRMGLSPHDFDAMARHIDAIYHAAAEVNLTRAYTQLRATNVSGTAEILRMACLHRPIPVHHISTVGVLPPTGSSGRRISPSRPLGDGRLLRHGYTQSKWVAESLVGQARERGLPVTVFRPTRISGDSESGICQTSDFLWLLVKGCVQAELTPGDYDARFDMIPVDYVSASITALSRDPAAVDHVYHLSSERPLAFRAVMERVREAGYLLKEVPLTAWRRHIERSGSNAALPLLSLLPTTGSSPQAGPGGSSVHLYDSAPTRRALAPHGIACPEIDRTVFERYLRSFIREGFLPPPPGGGRP